MFQVLSDIVLYIVSTSSGDFKHGLDSFVCFKQHLVKTNQNNTRSKISNASEYTIVLYLLVQDGSPKYPEKILVYKQNYLNCDEKLQIRDW